MKRFLLAILGTGLLAIPPAWAQEAQQPAAEGEEEKTLTFTDTVVVSGSKVEEKVIDSPATISVITADKIAANPAQNFGDLLRAVPGVTVIQTSARDVNLSSRNSGVSTLNNSQLALLDGRTIYLDFFGMILWDWVPTSSEEIKQIEVVRGPASVVWGANALTGIVNIITKPPREAKGVVFTMNGGLFDRECDNCSQTDTGYNYGANVSIAQAPNERWSYKISAGYFNSDPFSRPTGRIPVVGDPRTADPNDTIGGALYPTDSATGVNAFENSETSQPKVDVRVDNDMESGARLSIQGGYAGTEGIIHTGIGPFDIQSGSYMAYGRVGYTQGGFKGAVFGNFVDAEAPNLLQNDPNNPGTPIQLNFTTQTYDAELGYTRVLGGKHIISLGGNARRNNFDITIAPNSEDRNEFGAYLQDEIFFEKFRIAVGARVDKFGNLDDPVFSPRVSLMFKPTPNHAIRGSFNRAFRSPSVINNFIDLDISNPNLDQIVNLGPALPPPLRPLAPPPFLLTINLSGSETVDPRYNLKEEGLDAFEIAYTGTFNRRTTIGLALYQNDKNDNINFTSLLPSAQFPQGLPGLSFYSPQNPARGITLTGQPVTLSPLLMTILGQVGVRFPYTVFSYLNLGPVRDRGIETSLDHYFNENLSGFVNYSWQDDLEVLDADANEIPYPTDEIALPPTHRFNAGLNWNSERFVGMAQVNYVDDALWSDVLTKEYHGFTDAYTLVNASFGVKWNEGKITTTLKCMNLLNEDVQQHIFGDIMKRSVALELKFRY
ncbi:MAG TPA: TonB-dependent receptor [Vicinamibacteria bacterium]|nr:TonB-dependent receptor [Vicinamibacteria bacterium]